MVKALFIMVRKPDMSSEEFHAYWKDVHGPIAAKVPGLKKYVQSHALPQPPGTYDGVAELHFESAEAMGAGIASPEGQATMGDIPNFLDPAKSGLIIVEDVSIV